MAVEELVEIKFRLADGDDIGPIKFRTSASVASLKEKIIAQWPKDKENGPRSVNDIKLINAGQILENNMTVAQSRIPLSEVPGNVITMHVVIRPPGLGKQKDNVPEGSAKMVGCSCSGSGSCTIL